MLVRDAGVSFIMTSFNKINGVLAAGNRDFVRIFYGKNGTLMVLSLLTGAIWILSQMAAMLWQREMIS